MQPAKDCIFYIFLRAEKTIYAQSLPNGIQETLCGLTFRTFLLFELIATKLILFNFCDLWYPE